MCGSYLDVLAEALQALGDGGGLLLPLLLEDALTAPHNRPEPTSAARTLTLYLHFLKNKAAAFSSIFSVYCLYLVSASRPPHTGSTSLQKLT